MSKSLLQDQLEACAASRYPLHMPGHKRRVLPAPGLGCAAWDTTEVPGTDDLHDADGILAEAMARASALWGSRRCWFLVGGSTCGLLAAIRAAAPYGSEILCARNCHKSVYHAIELCALRPVWLTPPVDEAFGVYGSISPAMVADALAAHPGAACVVLTSPTYEGVLSDIDAIADLCHAKGIPLVVDEAHGAHYLPAAAPYGWQGGAVAAGADLVVQSAHKTLPSLTQTALLHLNGDLIDPDEVERQLDVFETSSPSYPLMVSLDGCCAQLAQDGPTLFAAWRARLDRFSAAVAPLRHLRVLCHGADTLADHPAFFAHDSGKILVNGAAAGLTGADMARMLREDYGFEIEMACGYNLLAMTSVCDADDALGRLADALLAMDAQADAAPATPAPGLCPPGEAALTIAEAVRHFREECPMPQAESRICAEYVWAYPPGVPLITPGERVTPAFLTACAALEKAGTALHHTAAKTPGCLAVCAHSKP